MLKIATSLLIFTLAFCFAKTTPFEPWESLPTGEYTVHRTIDADTIVIMQGDLERSVRLIGIDAPEKRGDEPFNKESTAFVRDLLTGQTVTITPGVEPVDRFGRALGYVSLQGRDVALTVAQEGYAEVLTVQPNDTFAPLYKAAVAGAKAARKGLWSSLDKPYQDRKWRCSSFGTQAEAQSFFLGASLPDKPDVFGLDRDANGRACQGLPSGDLLFREPPKS